MDEHEEYLETLPAGTIVNHADEKFVRMRDDDAMHVVGCYFQLSTGKWGHWSRICPDAK